MKLVRVVVEKLCFSQSKVVVVVANGQVLCYFELLVKVNSNFIEVLALDLLVFKYQLLSHCLGYILINVIVSVFLASVWLPRNTRIGRIANLRWESFVIQRFPLTALHHLSAEPIFLI